MVTLKAERGVVESFEERNCVVCTTSFNFKIQLTRVISKKLFTSFYSLQVQYEQVYAYHTHTLHGTLIILPWYNIFFKS